MKENIFIATIKLAFVTDQIRESNHDDYHDYKLIGIFVNVHLQIYQIHQIHPALPKFPARKYWRMGNFMHNYFGYTFSLKLKAYFDTWRIVHDITPQARRWQTVKSTHMWSNIWPSFWCLMLMRFVSLLRLQMLHNALFTTKHFL